MKKKLLIIFIITAVLAAAICALAFGGAFDKGNETSSTTSITTTQKRIPPAERDPILDEFVLDYSEDFNEFDIEFIKHMYERSLTKFPPVHDYEKSPDFCNHMERLSTKNNTFYKVNVDLDSEPYFISVYGNEGAYILQLYGCIDQVKWRKYYTHESILETADGEPLIGTYAVYDCVVEKDVLNSVVYNYSCKYYVPLMDGYYSSENNAYYHGVYKSVLWCDAYGLFGRSTPIAILHTLFFFEDMTKDMYEYYVDENGIEYLVMPYSNYKYYKDHGYGWALGGGSKLQQLKMHISRNSRLDDYYYENNEIINTLEKYCIPVKIVVDICWNNDD